MKTWCSCTRSAITLGKVLGKLGADGHRVAGRLAAHQDNHFSNELIYINQLPSQSALLEQQADAANDVRRTGYVFNDSRGRFACLWHIGLIASKPPQASFGVGDRRGNRLLDLVRQGGRSALPWLVTRLTRARFACASRRASSARFRRSRPSPLQQLNSPRFIAQRMSHNMNVFD